jgi:hypothetical protein
VADDRRAGVPRSDTAVQAHDWDADKAYADVLVENQELREALAYEARCIEAWCGIDLKSYPANRRFHMQNIIDRMRFAALNGYDPERRKATFSRELRNLEDGGR